MTIKHFAADSKIKAAVRCRLFAEQKMVVNWARVYNRIWEIINPADQMDAAYFSGDNGHGWQRGLLTARIA